MAAIHNKTGEFTIGKRCGKGSSSPHGKSDSQFEVIIRHVTTKRLIRTRHQDQDHAMNRVQGLKNNYRWQIVAIRDHRPQVTA